jgi:hypothetical protein
MTEQEPITITLKTDITDGEGVIKAENIHIHLPPPPDGYTYHVLQAASVLEIKVDKIGDTK